MGDYSKTDEKTDGFIHIEEASSHNLQKISLSLPKNALIVVTGVSGSGKSSLAFDTLFREGQRRYIEALSSSAKRQIGVMRRADCKAIHGLTPTLSIEQKTISHNPRSTVGTVTEIYDWLRLLFAKAGTAVCPVTKKALSSFSADALLIHLQEKIAFERKVMFLSPVVKEKKSDLSEYFTDFLRKGFLSVRVDGEIYSLSENLVFNPDLPHDLDLVIDRFVYRKGEEKRLVDAIEWSLKMGMGQLYLVEEDTETLYSTFAYSKEADTFYPPLNPQDFSFNSRDGMCPSCLGLGTEERFIEEKVVLPEKTIRETPSLVGTSSDTIYMRNVLNALHALYELPLDVPFGLLPREKQELYLYGTGDKWYRFLFESPEKGTSWMEVFQWRGVLGDAAARYRAATSKAYKEKMHLLMEIGPCSTCLGERLKPYPRATLFKGQRLPELVAQTIEETEQFLKNVTLEPQEKMLVGDVVEEIISRLLMLQELGLGYLSLDRMVSTLSGGEAQRVRLAGLLGAKLIGMTYVLDEPSIGLHASDQYRLIGALRKLQKMGNTVVVVEHDEETMRSADFIVDIGPGAGFLGGKLQAALPSFEFINKAETLTAAYLRGEKKIVPLSKRKISDKKRIVFEGISYRNFVKERVEIPLGTLTAVVGVSGSGKSSLMEGVLEPLLEKEKKVHAERVMGMEEIDKVIFVDQSPIGRTPRSNPATYTKVFDEIRTLFSALPEAQMRGFSRGRFSFNVEEGSCPECRGLGEVLVDLDFLESAWVPCTLCEGERFDSATLAVLYKGQSIKDVLDMEIEKAYLLFENIPSIAKKLKTLMDVGLGYLKLGQSSTTLSGGEAQRIKLTKELLKKDTGRTLYLLDEPTTGLHLEDISRVVTVLEELVDRGNTVVVIEHHLDFIKACDWVIELGPGAGKKGGKVIAACIPEELAKKNTPTGKELKKPVHLEKKNLHIEEAPIKTVSIHEATQNNLKKVSLELPRHQITQVLGPSGAGKSSLIFGTLGAEAERRYVETLSPYYRQFVKQPQRPHVKEIKGISAPISFDPISKGSTSRSTVGTMTEVYDYLRVLWSLKGTPYCPKTGRALEVITLDKIAASLIKRASSETKVIILSPFQIGHAKEWDVFRDKWLSFGYSKVLFGENFFSIEEFDPGVFDKGKTSPIFLVIDRFSLSQERQKRLIDALIQAEKMQPDRIALSLGEGAIETFFLGLIDPETQETYPKITPKTFAFNTIEGACPECKGLGCVEGAHFAEDSYFYDCSPAFILSIFFAKEDKIFLEEVLSTFLSREEIKTPLSQLKAAQKKQFLEGAEGDLQKGYYWRGVYPAIETAVREGSPFWKKALAPMVKESLCPVCKGARIGEMGRAVRFEGYTLMDICCWEVERVLSFFKDFSLSKEETYLERDVVAPLIARLRYLIDVGLGYLNIERTSNTLSGGEFQRVRLARQLGSDLTDMMYLLDEPSRGLHPKDKQKLYPIFKRLCDNGNTLVIIDHDPGLLSHVDFVVEMGPQGGEKGGEVLRTGSFEDLKVEKESFTALISSPPKKVKKDKKRETGKKNFIHIKNFSAFNIENLEIKIPLGEICAIAGVSGSGKSTLLEEGILPAVKNALQANREEDPRFSVDLCFQSYSFMKQDLARANARSDVCTFLEVLGPMREFFAGLPDARKMGLRPYNFSYNHLKGMCRECWGLGYKKENMLFMPELYLPCPVCAGMRLNKQSLSVFWGRYHLGNLLQESILSLLSLFSFHPKISKILQAVVDVGLPYLKIGQQIDTLSDGEVQRLKLARELSKKSRGKTLFLLDEPGVGLFHSEVELLKKALSDLKERGHSVIMIEHDPSLLNFADHVIEMGPGSGKEGGRVVYQGKY